MSLEACREAQEIVWDGSDLDWVKPRGCREYLRGVGLNYLHGVFDEAFKRILEDYKPSKTYSVMLIIPCSYGKPYRESYIHYHIRKAIADYLKRELVHEVIVTNAGVVPRELDEYWPYVAYDWNPRYEDKAIKECYTVVLASRLEAYIRRFKSYYNCFAAYLRWDSDSWRAVELASRRLGVKIPNLAPRTVPREEVYEASLGGLYSDPDIVLIARSSLERLKRLLGELVSSCS